MRRVFACVALLFAALPAVADRIAPPVPRPLTAAVNSDVVLVGTVTAVEDDPVKAKAAPDAKADTEFRVLVVKIDDGLLGVKNVTRVRVALTVAEFNSPLRTLKEDAKCLLYLTQHPTTNLLVPLAAHPSVNMAGRGADEILRRTKIVTAAIADPVKALKAEAKDDRVLAACGLAMYYRKVPPGDREAVARPADESKLLLAALAEGEWTLTALTDTGNPFAVVRGLGLEDAGLSLPTPANDAGYVAACQMAFKEWLAGKGKDARVKQLVPKK